MDTERCQAGLAAKHPQVTKTSRFRQQLPGKAGCRKEGKGNAGTSPVGMERRQETNLAAAETVRIILKKTNINCI